MNAARSRLSRLQAGEIGFSFGLALHDQFVLPDLEPERSQRRFGVARAQSQLKIRFALPRQFELDPSQRGKLEVTLQNRAALV